MKRITNSIFCLVTAGIFAQPVFAEEQYEGDYVTETYHVDLKELNNSSVYGTMKIKLVNENQMLVELEATGLEVNKPHPQHIHGLNKPVKNATCPTTDADTNGDGIISISEGVPAFGPIILPLVPFNLVDNAGHLQYNATFTIKPSALQPMHKRAVVLHGMTVNGEYIPSLPIACGEITLHH